MNKLLIFISLLLFSQIVLGINPDDIIISYYDLSNNNTIDRINYENGTRTGIVNTAQGYIGEGVYLSGIANTYLNFGSPTKTDFMNNAKFSFNAWINNTNTFDGAGSMGCLISHTDTDSVTASPYLICLNFDSAGSHELVSYATAWTKIGYHGNFTPNNLWTMLTITYDGTQMCSYKNSILVRCTSYSYTGNSNKVLRFGSWNSGQANNYQGYIDEISIYNDSLTQDAINLIYADIDGYPFNETILIDTYYNVTTSSSSTNISTEQANITINANITSNINITGNGTANLYYLINTSLNNGCVVYYQNVCINNGTYNNISMTQLSNTTFTTTFNDRQILPAWYPFNQEFIENSIMINETVYSGNHILMNVSNFSTITNYTLNLEFTANNKTGVLSNLLIYYCNSSYILNDGNPALRDSCELINTYSATNDCTHYHGNRCDVAVPVVISTITKTQNSYFIFVGQSNQDNGWNFPYTTNSTYNNASFRYGSFDSFNNAPTKTNHIYNIHLHSYNTQTDYFRYYVIYTNNGTSGTSTTKNIFYNISDIGFTTPNFINPNCLNSSTLIYTLGSTNDYNFTWTRAISQLLYTATYELLVSDVLDLNRVSLGNTTNEYLNVNSTIMNTINTGNRYFYVYANNDVSEGFSKADCTFNICTNSWTQSVQPCISNVKLITYTDSNNCNEQILSTLPANNGTYEACVEITYVENSYDNDLIIIVVIFVFLIVSTILAITTHHIFFVLNALLTLLLAVLFNIYNYPDMLMFAMGVLMIAFIGIWILIIRTKK